MPRKHRNYKDEYEKYHSSPEQKKKRAARNSARATMEAAGKVRKGDARDVDHIKPLSKGGSNAKSNLRVVSKSKNRSYKRKKDGSMA